MGRPIDEPPLKASACKALKMVEDELRKGFTGSFTLECQDGGVRDVRQSTRWKPSDAKDDAA